MFRNTRKELLALLAEAAHNDNVNYYLLGVTLTLVQKGQKLEAEVIKSVWRKYRDDVDAGLNYASEVLTSLTYIDQDSPKANKLARLVFLEAPAELIDKTLNAIVLEQKEKFNEGS